MALNGSRAIRRTPGRSPVRVSRSDAGTVGMDVARVSQSTTSVRVSVHAVPLPLGRVVVLVRQERAVGAELLLKL